MKTLLSAFIFSLLLTTHTYAIGFERVLVPDLEDKPLSVGIWYPSDAQLPLKANTPFRQKLALKGQLKGKNLPLVVLSHGYGGWMGGHADTAMALAKAGFIAIAPTHTGNNYEDESSTAAKWMIDRPRHIKLAIDYVIGDWRYQDRINANSIGVFGFSAGGYTALVSSGAIPNVKKLISHCKEHPMEIACTLESNEKEILNLGNLSDSAWHADTRQKAAVVVAPGFGFAMDEEALKTIELPVQIWTGTKDLNTPAESNSDLVYQARSEFTDYRKVKNAGHFAFIAPCNPKLEQANPKVWNKVCVDADGFDRRLFKQSFNKEVIAFYNKHLLSR